MRFIHWDGTFRARELSSDNALKAFRSAQGMLWIDLANPSPQQLQQVVEDFSLHPALVNDWVDAHPRPKVKEFETCLYVVLSCLDSTLQETHNLAVVVSRNLLLTVHKSSLGVLDTLLRQFAGDTSLPSKGPDHVFVALAGDIVDGFFPALDKMDGRVGFVESRVLNEGRERILNNLFVLKRQCLYLRKLLGPLRDVFSTLARTDSKFIRTALRPQFLSIYDHTLRLFETVDTYRDLLSSALEVYLSAQSNRMNEIMKTLTIIATIMMPLTVITGIYGMNFPGIPEFRWKFGYQAVLTTMGIITLGMLVWFRKRRWL